MAWKAEWHQRSVLAWFFFFWPVSPPNFLCVNKIYLYLIDGILHLLKRGNFSFCTFWKFPHAMPLRHQIPASIEVSRASQHPTPSPSPPPCLRRFVTCKVIRYPIFDIEPMSKLLLLFTVHDVRSQIESIHKMCQSFQDNDCSGLTLYYGKKKLRVWIQHKIIGEVT